MQSDFDNHGTENCAALVNISILLKLLPCFVMIWCLGEFLYDVMDWILS